MNAVADGLLLVPSEGEHVAKRLIGKQKFMTDARMESFGALLRGVVIEHIYERVEIFAQWRYEKQSRA